ncbi:MAG: threonine--tRNA ligase [Phycisphaerales bacterium]
MPRITLPDGSVREFDHAVSARDVAASIGAGLAKAAIGARIDGELRDLNFMIENDCSLAIVTAKNRDGSSSDDALFLVRHSCAHVMAEAIQRIVPMAQLVYGPPVDNGFYYDIAFPDDRALSTDDFAAIEAEMQKIIAEDRPFSRYELPVREGMHKLVEEASKYKVDNAKRAIDGGARSLSWYVTGPLPEGRNASEAWEDLCMGPHVPSTGRIGAFKIMSLASSYWHGDAESDSLTRVYGTAFADQAQLDAYLDRMEQAKQRDHRAINKRLHLFHIDETVGQGLVLWTPRGSVIRRELEEFIREELIKAGYDFVYTPHIGNLELYKTSGHYPYYADSQFPPLIERDRIDALAREGCSCADLANRLSQGEVEGFMLKPMNCPHHIKIFDSQPHSYRDMPVRLAEFGTVYRFEQSGELTGMTRVRGFTVDDAHLFVTDDQVADEVRGCLNLVKIVLTTLGLTDYRVRVGLRDPDSSKYVGEASNWDKAEHACRDAAKTLGVPFSEEPGEAAFYGPKIDFVVKDVIGREWQLGTVQVDYNLPQRFKLSYIGPDNAPHQPVMIHRAPFGSMERFMGVLIEHFEGAFPTWLAPEQVRVLPISEKFLDYANEVNELLRSRGIRSSVDAGDDRVQAKIKVGSELKVPYLLVVGGRDRDARAVSVRVLGEGDIGAVPLDEFVEKIAVEVRTRSLTSGIRAND